MCVDSEGNSFQLKSCIFLKRSGSPPGIMELLSSIIRPLLIPFLLMMDSLVQTPRGSSQRHLHRSHLRIISASYRHSFVVSLILFESDPQAGRHTLQWVGSCKHPHWGASLIGVHLCLWSNRI